MHSTGSHLKNWWKSGDPWVWMTAAAVAASMIMVVGLLILIAIRGLGHYWPASIHEMAYQESDGKQVRVIGEVVEIESVLASTVRETGYPVDTSIETVERYLLKTGNRDVDGFDFRWLVSSGVSRDETPADLLAMERHEWGNYYGYLRSVKIDGKAVEAEGEALWTVMQERIEHATALHEQIRGIEKHDSGAINYALERLRLKQRGLELKGELTDEALAEMSAERAKLDQRYEVLNEQLGKLYEQVDRDSLVLEERGGQQIEMKVSTVVRAYRPNAMSLLQKIGFYFTKLWEFVSDEPREANTEGGIFPAIFGTVMMVILMSVVVTPFGVIAAVYLREYAKQGPMTRTIRIAVNNLAGVPSIVYGVFGLGFFVYFLGGNIDDLFFPEAQPAPTFGTPGIFWAALTLAILTLPVVIVATEEGLSRIPRSIREGSLALGATKAETLWRTVLPMASPAMMTGLILAVARAAGEVAPLMLVGVVKLAPTLPLDGNFPFLHLERKFMHLGFHIYDVGFQSPNVEAARPLVYATSLLLVVVIIALNLAAIAIRNHLREKYRALEN